MGWREKGLDAEYYGRFVLIVRGRLTATNLSWQNKE